MLMTDDAPSLVEVDTEELRRLNTALNRLLGLKVDCTHVYRAWLAVDSDLTMFVIGTEVPADTILYLDSHRRPRTALIDELGHVQIRPGWKGRNEQ